MKAHTPDGPTEPPLRVLLVGEDPLARSGLAMVLRQDAGMHVVAEAGAANGLGSALVRHAPDVVLWDVGNTVLDHQALPAVPAASPPVVALVPDDLVGRAVTAGGARGVIYRDVQAQALVAAIRAVALGWCVLEPDVLANLLPAPEQPDVALDALTPREREVLALLVEGMPNRAIGTRLGISEHTAKFHVTAICTKLGARNRSDAVGRALRSGLVVV
jgi:two-component system nitrate/nitrite response regulator NarL